MARNRSEKVPAAAGVIALCGDCMCAVPNGEHKPCPYCGKDNVCDCDACTDTLRRLIRGERGTLGGELRVSITRWTPTDGIISFDKEETHGTK